MEGSTLPPVSESVTGPAGARLPECTVFVRVNYLSQDRVVGLSIQLFDSAVNALHSGCSKVGASDWVCSSLVAK